MIIIIDNGREAFDSKIDPVTIFFEKEEIYEYMEQLMNYHKIISKPSILEEQV